MTMLHCALLELPVTTGLLDKIADLKVFSDFVFPTCCHSSLVSSLLCVTTDRDHQQGQRASSSVPTHSVRGRGPTGCDPGGETGLERGTGEEADLRGGLQTGATRSPGDLQRSSRASSPPNGASSVSPCSSRASPKGRRPTSSTPCCACWSSTRPTWRT